jgi:hypothetical protein
MLHNKLTGGFTRLPTQSSVNKWNINKHNQFDFLPTCFGSPIQEIDPTKTLHLIMLNPRNRTGIILTYNTLLKTW